MTDRKRMIGEVAARHGIRLEEDDPAFLLVTLAELTMQDAQGEFLAAVRQATVEHEQPPSASRSESENRSQRPSSALCEEVPLRVCLVAFLLPRFR